MLWLLLWWWCLPAGWAFIEVICTTQRYRDLTASYGPAVPAETMTGYLVPIEYLSADGSRLGCDRLDPAYRETAFWRRLESQWQRDSADLKEPKPLPWIALVQRGGCSFGQKTMAMQASGAMAVIVGDNTPGPLIRMHADGREVEGVRIPSLFVQEWEYRELETLLRNAMAVRGGLPSLAVRLYPDDLIDWSTGEVILIGLVLPLFFFLLIMLLIKAREEAQAEEGGMGPFLWQDPRDRPAPRPLVLSLPCRLYDPRVAGANDPDCCAICLEDFYPEAPLRRLPCKHDFHQPCIDPWLLERKRTCPICKRDVCGEASEQQRREQARAREAFFGNAWLGRYRPLPQEPAVQDEEGQEVETPPNQTVAIPIGQPSLSSVRSAWTDRQAASVASLAARGVHVPVDDAEYEEARQLALTRRHLP